MTHVTHEFPRAFKAATEVDPLVLANALDHIAKTAGKSRTSTRRLRWIEQRALFALRGAEYRDSDLDLPKDPGKNTQAALSQRLKHQREALRELLDVCERMDLDNERKRPTEAEYQTAISKARTTLQEGAS